MNKHNMIQYISAYAPAAASILGGLVLLFCPDAATALVAVIIGWVALAIGILLLIAAAVTHEDLGTFLKAGISIAAGLWLINNPMSLAVAFGKLLGIGFLVSGFSGCRKSNSKAGRTIYLVVGLLGLVLLMAPLTATRAVYTVLGLILVVVGIVMLLNRLNKGRLDSGDGIIDV